MHFNGIVDSVINRVASLFGNQFTDEPNKDDLDEYFEEFTDDFENLPEIDISQKNPVFCGKYSGSTANFPSGIPDARWFKVSDYEVRAKRFSHSSEWKYISESYVFCKFFAIFTGEPELQIFDITSGLIYKCDVPVYPDKILCFDEKSLVFSGRDGESYYFSFTGEKLFNNNTEAPKSMKDFFTPDEKCTAAIKSRLDMWTDKKIDKLPPVSFFPTSSGSNTSVTSCSYDSEDGLAIYVYSPSVQGKYRIGFTDENGAWSDCSAFVFVFLQDGEMLSMSFEYYADKPQVEVHLSDKEIYYFVCGNMNDSVIPENTRIAVKGL